MPDLRDYLNDLIYGSVVGKRPSDLFAGGAADPGIGRTYPQPRDSDKRAHAYASMLMAQRYGRLPAFAVGLTKELSDWPGSGFDYNDLVANMVGIQRAR